MRLHSLLFKSLAVAHVLIPVYNAEEYFLESIQSIFKQSYPNMNAIFYDDGSTDKSMKILHDFLNQNPQFKNRVYIHESKINRGISLARNHLLRLSKQINSAAYIFWLDSDDQYTDSDFIKKAMTQMQITKADICLYNFSIKFEDEKQKMNAAGLLKEKEKSAEILKEIAKIPNKTCTCLEIPEILKFTSLGWTKCYAPWINIPSAEDCTFEDFVYMAVPLEAKITALPAEYEPLKYLRRSDSICGYRKPEHFTHDIPAQLACFFNVVTRNCKGESTKKLALAEEFVLRKFDQYDDVLKNLITSKIRPDIDDKVLNIYQRKVNQLKLEMNEIIRLSINPIRCSL